MYATVRQFTFLPEDKGVKDLITGGLKDWTCICLLIACICIGSVMNLLAVDAGAGASTDFAVVPVEDDELSFITAAVAATASAPFVTPVSDGDC